MENTDYDIPEAYVFHNGNVNTKEKIVYYPIYMLMFVKRGGLKEDLIYRLDLNILK